LVIFQLAQVFTQITQTCPPIEARHLAGSQNCPLPAGCNTSFICNGSICVPVICDNFTTSYCGPNNTCMEYCTSNENCTMLGYICNSTIGQCITNSSSSDHNSNTHNSDTHNSDTYDNSSGDNSNTRSSIHHSSKSKSSHTSSTNDDKSNVNNRTNSEISHHNSGKLSTSQQVIVGFAIAAGAVAVTGGSYAAYKSNFFGTTRVSTLLKSCCCDRTKAASRLKRLSEKKKEKELDEF